MAETFWHIEIAPGADVPVGLQNKALHVTRAVGSVGTGTAAYSVVATVRGAKTPLCHLSPQLPHAQATLDASFFPADCSVTFSAPGAQKAVHLHGVVAVDDDDLEIASGAFERIGQAQQKADADAEDDENGEGSDDDDDDDDDSDEYEDDKFDDDDDDDDDDDEDEKKGPQKKKASAAPTPAPGRPAAAPATATAAAAGQAPPTPAPAASSDSD
jgi:hypothetical protein